MRKMPQLTPGQKSIQMTSAFRGYNHNDVIADGEMHDMMNLSGDRYPLLSLRKKRGIASYDTEGQDPVPLTGIHGRDQLVFVRGTQVFWNFTPVAGISVSANEADCPKKIVSFGAYVLIWPDKVYFNTADLTDCGNMERLWPSSTSSITGDDVTVQMCRGDGTNYDDGDITTGSNPPATPDNGDLWIDTSGENDVLKQWSTITEEWVEVATTFVKIGATGIGTGLKEYDSITLSGLEAVDGITDRKIREQIDALNGSVIVYFRDDNYIVIAGLVSQSHEHLKDQAVRADLTIPDMDWIVESNNRLWGCTYGPDGNGSILNEIRCSKLGDFRNWNSFMGLSTDSWVASVGTDGAFTGATTQRGYPVFFKENCIHRVSGSLPANFSTQTTVCRGVQRGSGRSVCVVAENIYYKSRGAVMVYDGNMPEPVSDALGEEIYYNARAGVLGDKYYISMEDIHGTGWMFVYDTKHGNWWKEDSTLALGFGAAEDELFYIDETDNTLVSVRGPLSTEYTVPGSGGTDEERAWQQEADFDWAAEFNLIGTTYASSGYMDSPARVRNAKYLSLFKIRMELDPGAWVRLWIKYDDKLYEFLGERRGLDLRTFVLPVIPKRCDHIRFKLTGHGGAKVYDISRIMEVGGDG